MDRQIGLEREAQILYEMTLAINASFSQQEVLSSILERITTVLGYKAATIRLLDQERQQLELRAAYGLSEAYLTKGVVEVSKSGIDQIVLTGQRVIVADASQDPGFQYPDEAAQEGLASLLAAPLRLQSQVIGVLHIYTAERHEFSPTEQSLIAAVANLGAQSIQRTHLFEAFQRAARQLNSHLAPEEVLTSLLLESVRELNVKAGSVRLLGPKRERLHLAAAYGLSETYLRKGEVTVVQSQVDQRVLQEAQPIAITDLDREWGLQYPEEAKQEGIRSALMLPLQVHGMVVGVMRLYSGKVRRFSTEEINFATALADLGAVAIENAKLHETLRQRLENLKEEADGWYRFLTMG